MRVAIVLFFVLVSTNIFAQQKLVVHQSGNQLYVDHKVAPKENWYSVGRIYFISPRDIAAFNKLSMDKGLGIGQLLRIPLGEENFSQSDAMPSSAVKVMHEVQPKEGLLKVANIYKIDKGLLKKWNRLSTDQLKAGTSLTIGFLSPKVLAQDATITPVAVTEKTGSPSAGEGQASQKVLVVEEKALKGVTTAPVDVVVPEEKRKSSPAAAPANVIESAAISASPVAKSTQTAGMGAGESPKGYFASLFDQQSKEGQQQKLENSVYGVFKSTSGWQDGKYYVLMNNVVPGTVVKLVMRSTEKVLYAKVLGAVPPGKESEGMTLRMSNSTVAALGASESGSGSGVDLVWFN